MEKKQQVILSDEERALLATEGFTYEEDALPTKKDLRDAILRLHEAGKEDDAKKLMDFLVRLQAKPVRTRDKVTRVALFCLAIITGISGYFFFTYDPGDSDTIIVCSVGGIIYEGDECDDPDIPEIKKQERKDSTGIYVGSE